MHRKMHEWIYGFINRLTDEWNDEWIGDGWMELMCVFNRWMDRWMMRLDG